jgi:hypothetical protein
MNEKVNLQDGHSLFEQCANLTGPLFEFIGLDLVRLKFLLEQQTQRGVHFVQGDAWWA